MLRDRIATNAAAVATGLGKVVDATGSGRVGSAILSPLDQFGAATDALAPSVAVAVMPPLPDNLAAASVGVRDASQRLSQTVWTELDRLLADRLDDAARCGGSRSTAPPRSACWSRSWSGSWCGSPPAGAAPAAPPDSRTLRLDRPAQQPGRARAGARPGQPYPAYPGPDTDPAVCRDRRHATRTGRCSVIDRLRRRLGRLRVAQRLALLVLVPLAAVVGLAIPVVIDRGLPGAARRPPSPTRRETRRVVGVLLEELQRERLLSLLYLSQPGRGEHRRSCGRARPSTTRSRPCAPAPTRGCVPASPR